MILKATKGNVWIIPDPEPDTVAGFIYKPEAYREKSMPSTGTVAAIGGCQITKKGILVDPEFKVGDHVLFRKYSGFIYEVRGKRFIQIKIPDVEAVLGS